LNERLGIVIRYPLYDGWSILTPIPPNNGIDHRCKHALRDSRVATMYVVWYATNLAVVDASVPPTSVVANHEIAWLNDLATGVRCLSTPVRVESGVDPCSVSVVPMLIEGQS
jgi:hypothetical protein